jgi:hypothetical protein
LDNKLLSHKISLFGCIFAAVVVLRAVAVAHNGVAALSLLSLVALLHTLGQQKTLT